MNMPHLYTPCYRMALNAVFGVGIVEKMWGKNGDTVRHNTLFEIYDKVYYSMMQGFKKICSIVPEAM